MNLPFLRNLAIVALVALAIVVIPGGGNTLDVLLTVLTLAFFVAIGLFAVRMFRENRMTLDALSDRQRGVLYGSVGLAFLTFTATGRLFDLGGLGILGWLGLLGLCSYGVFWVYTQARQY